MVVKKLKNPDPECAESIKDILKAKMITNPDGFYLAGNGKALRTMDRKKAESVLDDLDMDILLSHFRIATQGKKELDNVQGWTIDNWTFIHNGSFGGYSEIGKFPLQYEKSDSLRFFEELLAKLKKVKSYKDKAVRQAIQDTISGTASFWGRCVLHDRTSDRLFLFGDWHLYALADSHLIISSAKLDFGKTNKTKTINGLEFKFSGGNAEIGEGEIDGISVIKNFSSYAWSFKQLGSLEKPKNNFGFRTDDKPKSKTVYSSDFEYNPSYNHSDKFWDHDTRNWVKKTEPKEVKVPVKDGNQKHILLPEDIIKEQAEKAKLARLTKTDSGEIDEYDLFQMRINNVVGKNADGWELYEDDGTLGAEPGIHDIYLGCCRHNPKKCIPVEEFGGADTFYRDGQEVKVFSDGTEFVISRPKAKNNVFEQKTAQ